MTTTYTARDLVTVAIGIERRGHMFYDVMAKSVEDEKTRAVFEGLASMERVHLATFEKMLEDVHDDDMGAMEDTGEYVAAVVENAVFSDDAITGEMALQADSDDKALELAIATEKDSLVLYYVIRDIMPDRMVPLLDAILDEEKRHLRQLTHIRKNIADAR